MGIILEYSEAQYDWHVYIAEKWKSTILTLQNEELKHIYECSSACISR